MGRRSIVRSLLALGLLGAIVGAPAVLAGCGGGGAGRTGGQITVLQTNFPDYLDPALSYTVDGWEPLTQVYPGLLSFVHASGAAGAKVRPALADALPRISADGRTYSLRLRKRINFSDGTPIRASDFKHSIERVLATDSQGVGLGYTNIVGAEQFGKTKTGGITGIVVNDATGDIAIHLVKPRGSFTYELAIPFAAVVPASTPSKNQTPHPPPGAGRYAIKNVEQGRGYSLVRNAHFSPGLVGTTVDVAKVNGINVKINSSISAQVTQIANNQADFMIDNPTADRAGEVRSKYTGKRYREFPTTSTYYFFMNTEAPPFDKLAVRQAVNWALDFDAINRIQAGFLAKTHGILPSQIPGYEPSPDLYPGPNLQKAQQLIAQAGAKGAQVTVWSDNQDPTPQTMAYYTDLLNRIGLKAKLKSIAAQTYFATIGDRSLKAQTGWSNWTEDYPHPADFIDVLLNPDNVVAVNNNNLSYNAFDRGFAGRINAVAAKPLNSQTEQEWAALDRYAQQQAYWAIYGTRKQSTFFSDRMNFQDCKGDDWPLATHDWGRFCLK
jgi:peptide/nickel transport system substrate-binding protein